eukprot:scaffold124427_cov20-Tisochrysis_lutea.AAC.5
MSGQPTYEETTRLPGAMTTSPPAVAAMDKESLPPSQAMPISIIISLHHARKNLVEIQGYMFCCTNS